jgi:hypothetical protein
VLILPQSTYLPATSSPVTETSYDIRYPIIPALRWVLTSKRQCLLVCGRVALRLPLHRIVVYGYKGGEE